MVEPERDEALVKRYLHGQAPAFTELVRRHERRVYNLCLRMLGREEDAHDATQDTFLTALRKLDQFRGDAAFTTWLHRVAVNACYDLLRKRARSPMLRPEGDEPETDIGPPAPDHADAVAARTDVERALVKIPVEYRAVLVLHDVQDMAYEDIAHVLEVPVGTVKSRLHRGRLALARALGIRVEEHARPPGASDGQP